MFSRGIEVNLKKIWAIQEMTPLNSIKEVQCPMGKVASLNCFVSRSTKKYLPFFKILKQLIDFQWTIEAQYEFEELMKYLRYAPLLSKTEPSKELFLYLAMSPIALSSVLVQEEGKSQKSVYYISKVFHNVETRYTRLEKFIFALILSTRKLRPYHLYQKASTILSSPQHHSPH